MLKLPALTLSLCLGMLLLCGACNLQDESPPTQRPATTTAASTPPACVSEPERCDDVDNDCDGVVDNGCDDDDDNFCEQGMEVVGMPAVCPLGQGDCDDEDASVNPNTQQGQLFYPDQDRDGFGDDAGAVMGCSPPAGYLLKGGDCDDDDSSIYPMAPDICDGLDNDCDASTQEECDRDQDGYCESIPGVMPPAAACPLGGGDCDDDDALRSPKAEDVCDDVDNDCDGVVDNTCDGDGDGYCAEIVSSAATLQACPLGAGDCDDDDAMFNPGAAEVCANQDFNCDGQVGLPVPGEVALLYDGHTSVDSPQLAQSDTSALGAAWLEFQGVSQQLFFRVADPAQATLTDTVALTPLTQYVSSMSLTWAPTLKQYVLAYTAFDAELEMQAAFLVRVGEDGIPLGAPALLGPASGTIRVSVRDGLAVVLYQQVTDSIADIYHVAFDLMDESVSASRRIAANKTLNQTSLAHLPITMRRGGIVTLVWRNPVTLTQSRGYERLVIYADDGLARSGLSTRQLSPTATRISVHRVADLSLLAWLEQDATTPQTSDYVVRTALLTDRGDMTTAPKSLAVSAYSSSDYDFVTNELGEVTLIYERQVGTQRLVVGQKLSLAAQGLDVASLPFNLETSSLVFSYQGAHLSSHGTLYHYLGHDTYSQEAVDLLSFGDAGTLEQTTTLTARTPQDDARVIVDVFRDESQGLWRLLYANQNLFQKLTVLTYSLSDGTQEVAELPDPEDYCSPSFDDEGRVVCAGQVWDHTACQGVFRSLTYDATLGVWDATEFALLGSRNAAMQCQYVSAFGASTQGLARYSSFTELIRVGAASMIYVYDRSTRSVRINAMTPQGLADTEVLTLPEGTNLSQILTQSDESSVYSLFNLSRREPDNSTTHSLTWISYDRATGDVREQGTLLDYGVGQVSELSLNAAAAGMWVLGTLSTQTTYELKGWRFEAGTLKHSAELTQVPREGYITLPYAAAFEGDLVVVRGERATSSGQASYVLERLAPDFEPRFSSPHALPQDPTRGAEGFMVFGQSDYMGLIQTGQLGQALTFFDETGEVLGEQTLKLAGASYNYVYYPYDGLLLVPLYDGERVTLVGNELYRGSTFVSEAVCQ